MEGYISLLSLQLWRDLANGRIRMLGRWTTVLQPWPAGSTGNQLECPQKMACSEQPSVAAKSERKDSAVGELIANSNSHNHHTFLRPLTCYTGRHARGHLIPPLSDTGFPAQVWPSPVKVSPGLPKQSGSVIQTALISRHFLWNVQEKQTKALQRSEFSLQAGHLLETSGSALHWVSRRFLSWLWS